MSGYTRLTLVGSARRVDVVLPDNEPVGRLLPEALELAGEASASPATERRLALLDGRLLEQDLSLGEADVPDGAVVRIVGLAEAPPPPIVLDVTEEAAEDSEERSWRWGAVPRRWTATALAAVATVAALVVATPLLDRPALVVPGTAAVLMVAGAVVGRLWKSVLGTALILCGSAAALYAVWLRDLEIPVAVAAVAGIAAVTVLALGVASSLGRAGLVGGAVGLLLLGCWLVATASLPGPRAAACLAVLTTVILGLLPRLAAVLAGLTRLDDRRARDEPVRRRDIATALRTTHRGLALATVAVAVSALVAGVRLLQDGQFWTTMLAVLLVVVLLVRVRAFPLATEVVALAVALAGLGLALLLALLAAMPGTRSFVVGVLVAAVVIGLALPLIRFSPQLRARGRVLGDRLEVVAVVAMLPVLVGVFGVYPRLLESF